MFCCRRVHRVLWRKVLEVPRPRDGLVGGFVVPARRVLTD